MEILTILLIFSIGVIVVGACFIGGIAFVYHLGAKLIKYLFGRDK